MDRLDMIPAYFYSCDWGTSHFRLRLVESTSLQVIQELQTDQGVKTVYSAFKAQNEKSQFDFFCTYLVDQVVLFPPEHHNEIVMLSGMASSSIGLMELDYTDMPFAINGGTLKWKYIQRHSLKILLISGVKSQHDIMRGEEIQAVGLSTQMSAEEGLLILPGTHSKHISFEDGSFIHFKTYMTGEMFELISSYSVLSNSVRKSKFSTVRKEAFKKGLDIGIKGDLTSQLFSIRVSHLLQHTDVEDNYFTLSGMLIGHELAYLNRSSKNIFIAAAEPLLCLYVMALNELVDSKQITTFTEVELDAATLSGHWELVKQIDKLTV